MADINGTNGKDDIIVNDSNVTVDGLGSRDRIWSYGDNNIIDGGSGNDVIKLYGDNSIALGGNGNDVLRIKGGTGNELHGEAGNDKLYGRSSADIFVGGADDDYINGRGGIDTAIFSGNRNDYNIVHVSGTTYRITDLVAGRDGVDTVLNVELFQFADAVVSVGNLLNLMPTDIVINNATIDENMPIGSVVGVLDVIDPDLGDTHTLTLLNHTDKFEIVGNELRTLIELDFEDIANFDLQIQADDGNQGVIIKNIPVSVNNVAEAPVAADDLLTITDEDSAAPVVLGNLLNNDVGGSALTIANIALVNENGDALAIGDVLTLNGHNVVEVTNISSDVNHVAIYELKAVELFAQYASTTAILSIAHDGEMTLIQNKVFNFLLEGQNLDLNFAYQAQDAANLLSNVTSAALTINGADNQDVFIGLNISQNVTAGDSDDWIITNGNHLIGVDTADDVIDGGDGNDIILGDANTMAGGLAGNDQINDNAGGNLIWGDASVMSLNATGGNDIINAIGNIMGDANTMTDSIGGDDLINAGSDSTVYGDAADMTDSQGGNDTINGSLGDGSFLGDAYRMYNSIGGNDVINGGIGNDFIAGDASYMYLGSIGGDDTINAGDGDDTIWGDGQLNTGSVGGNDVITGGNGNDQFVYHMSSGQFNGNDVITDFTYGEDKILLISGGFPTLEAFHNAIADVVESNNNGVTADYLVTLGNNTGTIMLENIALNSPLTFTDGTNEGEIIVNSDGSRVLTFDGSPDTLLINTDGTTVKTEYHVSPYNSTLETTTQLDGSFIEIEAYADGLVEEREFDVNANMIMETRLLADGHSTATIFDASGEATSHTLHFENVLDSDNDGNLLEEITFEKSNADPNVLHFTNLGEPAAFMSYDFEHYHNFAPSGTLEDLMGISDLNIEVIAAV